MAEYDIFIPVNERISKIKELIIKTLAELTDNDFKINSKYNLIDPDTGNVYENKMIVRELNIRNSKKIILY